jgi:two-component system sensor histidine kinase BarA
MNPIPTDTAILDLKNLNEAFEGDVEGIVDILQMAVETTESTLPTLRTAIAAGDAAAVAKAAHGIKGAAANVGGKEVAKAFSTIEERARDGSLAHASADLETALAALDRFNTEVARYRAKAG